MFEKWKNNPSTENKEKYKTTRNKVSVLIREAKIVNYRKIGKDISAKCIYRTLKAIKCNQESSPPVIDPDIMNEFFVLIGPMLSFKLPVVDTNINITRVENNVSTTHRSMGSCKNSEINEKQEKVMAWMELVMKFSNASLQLLSPL